MEAGAAFTYYMGCALHASAVLLEGDGHRRANIYTYSILTARSLLLQGARETIAHGLEMSMREALFNVCLLCKTLFDHFYYFFNIKEEKKMASSCYSFLPILPGQFMTTLAVLQRQ